MYHRRSTRTYLLALEELLQALHQLTVEVLHLVRPLLGGNIMAMRHHHMKPRAAGAGGMEGRHVVKADMRLPADLKA